MAEAPVGSLLTLRRLPLGYRILYTGVLVLFAVGYAAGLLQQHLRTGLTPTGVAAWILGNEQDAFATQFLFALPPYQVLDTVWRRSLADVIPSTVLLALLFRAGVAPRVRAVLSLTVAASALADMAGPALIHWAGPAWGVEWWAAQWLLALGAWTVLLLCIGEMWFPRAGWKPVRGASRDGTGLSDAVRSG